jgi:DNA-binding transcriptional MerR regulator
MIESVTDVSTSQAATQMGLSPRTLQHWARKGLVQPALVTAGGHYRWDVDDLRRQLHELHATDQTAPERPDAAS